MVLLQSPSLLEMDLSVKPGTRDLVLISHKRHGVLIGCPLMRLLREICSRNGGGENQMAVENLNSTSEFQSPMNSRKRDFYFERSVNKSKFLSFLLKRIL